MYDGNKIDDDIINEVIEEVLKSEEEKLYMALPRGIIDEIESIIKSIVKY